MSAANGNPNACLLIIGNEILSGRTRDENLSFIGRRCAEIGVSLAEARVIADEVELIVRHVNSCRTGHDYVFTTGGIGPTHDDITAASIARAFGVPLLRNADADAALQRYYRPDMLNAARLRMADIPAGARLIDNPVSGAPGFQLENVFVFAGVPRIMQVMFDGIVDRLAGGNPIRSESVPTDLREGDLAADLARVQDQFSDVGIGSYPYFLQGTLGVNIVLRSTDAERLRLAAGTVRDMIRALGGTTTG